MPALPLTIHTDHPDAVMLLSLVSRYAKHPQLGFGDKAGLYRVKRDGLHQLVLAGRLHVHSLSSGSWPFGDALEHAPPRPEVLALVSTARLTQQPIAPAALQALGLRVQQLPFRKLTGRSSWRTLSASQRSQLHPRGAWLVGLSLPGGTHCLFHQPFWEMERWATLPEPSEPRQDIGAYGKAITAAEQREWPVRCVLHQLGVNITPELFPGQLKFSAAPPPESHHASPLT